MKINLLSILFLTSVSVYATEPACLPSINGRSHVSVFEKKLLSDDGDRTCRSIVKINIIPIALGCYSFAYEFSFHRNFSAAIGVGFFNLPNYVKTKAFPVDALGNGLQNITTKGYSITPEIRFYPGMKIMNQAPHGFYLAPYLRYSKTNIAGDFKFDMPSAIPGGPTTKTNLQATISYSGINGGLLIGKQWVFGHFSIDWWIVGFGAGKAKLNADFYSSSLNLTPSQQAELKDQLDSSVNDVVIPGFNIKSNSTTSSHGAKLDLTDIPMLSIRSLGLSLGFAF